MKKIVVSLAMIMAVGIAKAQFSHSAGASLFLVSSETGDNSTCYGVTYFPKYSFGGLSVGVPLTVGFSGSVNSRSGASDGASFTYQLPIVVDYNFGLGASEDSEGGIGGYVGVGYSAFSTSYVSTFSSGTLKANGPMGRAGVRFGIGEHILSIGGSFLKGGGTEKANVIGISALYSF
jgi:hypothetical protein